jgi:hypothetical protein
VKDRTGRIRLELADVEQAYAVAPMADP